jgi:chemotaxis protein MotB
MESLMRIATRLRFLLAVAPCLLVASCVSQKRYDESLGQTQYYQRLYQDLESYQGKLEAENERLRGELELRGPVEAGATQEIDAKIAALRQMVDGLGAPTGDVTVLQVEGGYGLRLTDAVLFDSGSTTIKPEGRELLAKLAQDIQSRPCRRIWVRGHTDSDRVARTETKERFPHGNLELSAARAVEVASFLTSDGGMPAEKVVVAGFGPNEPVAANDSPENKRRNRRVEIFVLEEESSGTQP